jgi:hypothetical protein
MVCPKIFSLPPPARQQFWETVLISNWNVRRARLPPRPFGRAKQLTPPSRNTKVTPLDTLYIYVTHAAMVSFYGFPKAKGMPCCRCDKVCTATVHMHVSFYPEIQTKSSESWIHDPVLTTANSDQVILSKKVKKVFSQGKNLDRHWATCVYTKLANFCPFQFLAFTKLKSILTFHFPPSTLFDIVWHLFAFEICRFSTRKTPLCMRAHWQKCTCLYNYFPYQKLHPFITLPPFLYV